MIPELEILSSESGSDPDKRDYLVSNERIEKAGWKPNVQLEEGIRELITGYKIIKPNRFSNV